MSKKRKRNNAGPSGQSGEAGPSSKASKSSKNDSPFAVLKHVRLENEPRKPASGAARSGPAAKKQEPSKSPATGARQAGAAGGRDPGTRSYEDRVLLSQAYSGVDRLDAKQPMRRPRPAPPPDPRQAAARAQAEQEARARLDQLVGGGQRFVVERDGDHVFGRRADASPRTEGALVRDTSTPSRRIDLHGLRAEDARQRLVAFVRDAARRGLKRVLVVHGRGKGSPGGQGVLADVVVDALTSGGAAPVVRAFVTPPRALGGGGALIVFLRDS